MKVERRFLTISRDWEALINRDESHFIVQGYPDELQTEGVVGRVRDTLLPDGAHVYERAAKKPATNLTTPEAEMDIAAVETARLLEAAGKATLRNWRHFIVLEPGVTVMIDQFAHIRHELVDDLVISEIEFTGAAMALATSYTPPDWIGEEITGKFEWSNYQLCLHGRPIHT